ncbi:hypothetical protein RHMOL_Rhmol08G0102400 [Rhododendron molle]|uniref:Uncharacterized protein n=1 Tax=Rhododendron molle TaxID=49168 RepID=A0ACC0MLW7_RHOML|nr:hypothetical protein RHMOL_Rhmol08G0102400 [Rhododendron molle]
MLRGWDRPLSEWLHLNLKFKISASIDGILTWPTLLITFLWQIWKDRNKKSFDNMDSVVSISAKLIYSYARKIEEAFKSLCMHGPPHSQCASWIAPVQV